MKRKWLLSGFSISRRVFFIFIFILLLLLNNTKTNAVISFYSAKDNFSNFLNSIQDNSINKDTLITEANKISGDNIKILNTKVGVSLLSELNGDRDRPAPIITSQDLQKVLPLFILQSLNKDAANFYQVKNNDIDLAIKEINSLQTSTSTDIDKEFISKLDSILNNSKIFFNDSSGDYYTSIYNTFRDSENVFNYNSSYGTATNNSGDLDERIYSSLDGDYSINTVASILLRSWRIYLYNAIIRLKSDYSNKGVSQNILDYVGEKDSGTLLSNIYDPKGIRDVNQSLTANEVLKQQATIGDVTVPLKLTFSTDTGTLIPNADTNGNVDLNLTKINNCQSDLPFMSFNPFKSGDSIVSNNNCSVVAYLINKLLSVITSIFFMILNLVIGLFNWTIHFGIENFSNLVKTSGAYIIYQKIVLALIVSLILPFIFYILLRDLIDNDLDRSKKILPRLIFTALFVYFSFTIAGMIIDQANILSLKVASTLNSSGTPLPETIRRLILTDQNGKDIATPALDVPSPGDPSSIPLYLVQTIIVGAAIIVFFQAAILIFARAIILLLCLIFSPIMLLPKGINDKVDEYKKKITVAFTNNIILAPIFLLLVLIAIKIGQVGSQLVNAGGASLTASGWDSSALTASIAGVISIIVLMMAIKFAKQLSGDLGMKIGGKISEFTGKVALGGLSMAMKGGVNTLAKSERFQGWMKKGTLAGRGAYSVMNKLQDSTFDLRNNKTFKNATGGSFGQGTSRTAEDTYNRKLNTERRYNNFLNEEGKERHLNRLDFFATTRPIARDIRGKKNLDFEDSLRADNKQNRNFNRANSETDKDKREKKVQAEIDKHFKNNGYGDKYFSKELADPANAALLQKFKKANDEPDEAKRKTEFLKVIKEFEDTVAKQKNTNTQTQNNNQNTSQNTTQPTTQTGNQNTPTVNRTTQPTTQTGNQNTPSTGQQSNSGTSTLVNSQGQHYSLTNQNNQRVNNATAYSEALQKNVTPLLSSIKNSIDSLNQNVLNMSTKNNKMNSTDIKNEIKSRDNKLRDLEQQLNNNSLTKSEKEALEKEFNRIESENKSLNEQLKAINSKKPSNSKLKNTA